MGDWLAVSPGLISKFPSENASTKSDIVTVIFYLPGFMNFHLSIYLTNLYLFAYIS